MSTYDQILGTISQIADAAIEWDMNLAGWWKTDSGWVSDLTVAPATIYNLDFTGTYMTASDGERWEIADGTFGELNFRESWRGWYERVNELFRPWLGIPDPAGFDTAITKISRAAAEININTVVTAKGAEESAALESGNGDLDSDLREYVNGIGAMSGVTMDVFSRGYSNRLPGVIAGDLAVLGILGSTVAGQQNLMKAARDDVAKVADDVLVVMREKQTNSSSDGLAIIGAVAAGASIFFTGGAAAVVIKNGRAILTVLGAMEPKGEASPAETEYGARDPQTVVGRVETHLQKMSDALRQEEEIVRSSLTGALDEVTTQSAEVFDLSFRAGLLDVPDRKVVVEGEIDVVPESLATLGTIVGPDIAAAWRDSRKEASGAPDVAPWTRAGAIGLYPHGGFDDWAVLHDEFIGLVTGNMRALGDINEKLVDVAGLYVDVDEVVARYLAEVEAYPTLAGG